MDSIKAMKLSFAVFMGHEKKDFHGLFTANSLHFHETVVHREVVIGKAVNCGD